MAQGLYRTQVKEEDVWDEEGWQREFNALPFVQGVDDAIIKEEELSDEEPWPPQAHQKQSAREFL
jgi:hypothetical protein